ncbi:MAG: AmmeMemoRadiSam system protein A [Gammaproteobacteria bacterium]|nr:AmmeMemoRadiSam system protein A [Gammaproteobacteria bacterium]
MSSTDTNAPLARELRARLIGVARDSIAHGLAHGRPLAVLVSEYPPALKAMRASFVTLQIGGALRGCIGHLEAVQPLVVDVAENAFAAAFRDPRFPALTAREWPDVEVHLSILTPAQPITFVDEPDLLAQLRPGEDGLILEDGPNRGTFLPSVWESLPDAGQFLTQLKRKAGLAANHWSEQLRIYRYGTESFGDADVA